MVDTLVKKCVKALQQTGMNRLVIAGGVSANLSLRTHLEQKLAAIGASVHYAPPALCTDNGAMIAFAGWQRLQAGQQDDLAVGCFAPLDITSLACGNVSRRMSIEIYAMANDRHQGVIRAIVRGWLARLNPLHTWIPVGTLLANIVGGLLMGVALAYVDRLSPPLRTIATHGIFGRAYHL